MPLLLSRVFPARLPGAVLCAFVLAVVPACGGDGPSSTPTAPVLSALDLDSAYEGSAGISLAVNGTGFETGATVRWNGADRPTAFQGATRLVATIPAADLTTATTAKVTVRNPDAGTESAARDFRVVPFTWKDVTAGSQHTCGIGPDDRAYCWGYGMMGQLGFPIPSPDPLVTRPTRVQGNLRWKGITTGARHTCAITIADQAYCWGVMSPVTGATPNPVPTIVTEDPGFRSLEAGGYHTCGISNAGATYCWGDNGTGALGVGRIGGVAQPSRANPTAVAGAVSFTAVAPALDHTCAVSADGRRFCWGSTNAPDPAAAPRELAGGPALVSIEAGGAGLEIGHRCGLTAAGEAWCWGLNDAGQLGDGTTSTSEAPVRVQGLTGTVLRELTLGSRYSFAGRTPFTCGVSTTNEAWCWGDNQFGELADGSRVQRTAAVRSAGLLRFRKIDAGGAHACGITLEGRMYCWGRGTVGQLGDARSGEDVTATTPVAVLPPT